MRFSLLILALILTACAALPGPAARTQDALRVAHAKQWERLSLNAPPFALTAFGPPATGAATPVLHIYIEGDGLAWRDRRTPSSDPTPTYPAGLHMALADSSGVAAYLARPCQYGTPHPDRTPALRHNDGACGDNKWWTGHRFSSVSVDAMSRAVDQLKERYHADKVILIGYSGGGAIATLLAARRADIAGFITVAGTLDTDRWVTHHRITPLYGSLNPAHAAKRLEDIPQYHLSGGRDKAVPPLVATSYAARFPASRNPPVEIVPQYDHKCCWAEDWPAISARAFAGMRPTPDR